MGRVCVPGVDQVAGQAGLGGEQFQQSVAPWDCRQFLSGQLLGLAWVGEPPHVTVWVGHVRVEEFPAEHSLAADFEARAAVPDLPRLFLLDDEYSIAVREGVLRALRSGELTWSEEWIRAVAEKFA